MGIALHLHVAFQTDAARPGHAAQVVAAQIHQHDMLGPLLGVVAQFGGQTGILQLIPAPPPRARYGRKPQASFLTTDHDLRRGTEQGQIREAHVKHVGRSVEAAHAPVKFKRIAGKGRGKAYRGHYLDGLALAQHFLDLFHMGLVAGLAGFSDNSFRVCGCCAVPPGGGSRRGMNGAQGTALAQADLAETVVKMVENQHCAGQNEPAVRLVRRHDRGQSGVEQTGHAEAQITVQGAGDGRQVGDVFRGRDLQTRHELAQPFHKGASFQPGQRREALVFHAQGQLAVTAGDEQGHVAGQNAVAAPAPVHLGAFEQNAVARAHHAHKQADGRVHVRREPAGGLPHCQRRWYSSSVFHLRFPRMQWKQKSAVSRGDNSMPARLPPAC